MNSSELNLLALSALQRGDFYQAQELFRKNARKYPNHFSYNNLGQYYVTEGRESDSGNTYCANWLGLHYLQKAASLMETPLNLINLGAAWVEQGAYQRKDTLIKQNAYLEASKCFGRANELQADIRYRYNMAVCLFRAGKYENADKIFSDVRDNMKVGLSAYIDNGMVCTSALYSLYYTKGKEALKMALGESMSGENIEEDDFFTLCYLCEDYGKAAVYAKRFLQSLKPSDAHLAMIVDVLLHEHCFAKDRELIQYLTKCSGESNYKARRMVDETDYRQKWIGSYLYIPSIIAMCGYFGCKIEGHDAPPFIDIENTKLKAKRKQRMQLLKRTME